MTNKPYPHGIVFPEELGEGEAGFTLGDVANAIQCWSVLQGRTGVTVREAATAFNLDDEQVQAAVAAHYWMFLSGPADDPTKQIIEHEGE